VTGAGVRWTECRRQESAALLCFSCTSGRSLAQGPGIDFNIIYRHAIKPGIADADMFPVRADEEKLDGALIDTL
jgi:hypothetical protein